MSLPRIATATTAALAVAAALAAPAPAQVTVPPFGPVAGGQGQRDVLNPFDQHVVTSRVSPVNGHLYILMPEGTWQQSKLWAESLGGNLVTIRTQFENDWLADTFGSFGGLPRDLWIGLTDEATEGTFEWVSGEPFTFDHWAPLEPSNWTGFEPGGEDYVHLYSPQFADFGKWNDNYDVPVPWYVGRQYGVCEILPHTTGLPHAVSIATGGTQQLLAQFTPDLAGSFYVFLGSQSGTSPQAVLDGVSIPLVDDPYFQLTLAAPNTPPLSISSGNLDATGLATGQFDVPAGALPLIGQTWHHAAVVFDGSGTAIAASPNAAKLEFVP